MTVTRAKAEAAVLDHLAEIAADVDKRAAVKRARVETARNAKADAAAARRDLARAETALERLASRWAHDEIPADTFAQVRDDLLRDKASAQKRLDEAVAVAREVAGPPMPVVRRLLSEWETLAVRDKRLLLGRLIRSVRVMRGERRGDVRVVVDGL